ncbi:MAG: EVE domain-containing protein [Alphaproteobacteria bacterium]
MAYWLMKSEPATWSWQQQVDQGPEPWTGVRNHQAANNMKAMRLGDRAFFYHSGEERAIKGVVEIVKTYYPDPTDPTGRFGMVDVRAVMPVKAPVTLAMVKAEPRLKDFALVRQSRLSVMPVSPAAWAILCKMAGIGPG